ncbi:MAG: acyl carrier protein [Micromonosporaceae bacterium]|nr:acyl carrier protein [Micromonosporaceae bacterium]
MSAPADERTRRIKEIVCEVLEINQDELTDTSLFREEHGADSLRAIEIVALLEKEFNVVVDQAQFTRMVDLAGVRGVIAEAAGWQP